MASAPTAYGSLGAYAGSRYSIPGEPAHGMPGAVETSVCRRANAERYAGAGHRVYAAGTRRRMCGSNSVLRYILRGMTRNAEPASASSAFRLRQSLLVRGRSTGLRCHNAVGQVGLASSEPPSLSESTLQTLPNLQRTTVAVTRWPSQSTGHAETDCSNNSIYQEANSQRFLD